MTQAGNYAMVLHYLKAMEALGGNPHDGAKVVAKMKELPTDDPLFGKGPLRADGRRLIPAYLFEVKKPEELKGPWDYYKQIATIAAGRRRQAARSQRVSAAEEVKKRRVGKGALAPCPPSLAPSLMRWARSAFAR